MIKEKDPEKLIMKISEELKKTKEIQPPEWSSFVKTGQSRQRPPSQEDWWWLRSASILRKIYIEPKGVTNLRKLYGGRKNRGHKPERKKPASGAIIRKMLQQLEAAGYVKHSKGKGRAITSTGQSLLDKISKEL